ncbi:MAG: N-acetylmuramoyl-L-alanine amidase [Bowdeniella nasicola]|nr:N-acetylmuramoyl-L-alanine amidase [Bowdeniella nasicola]
MALARRRDFSTGAGLAPAAATGSRSSGRGVLAALTAAVLLASGCTASVGLEESAFPPGNLASPTATTTPSPRLNPTPSPEESEPRERGVLALDPGHNGANAAHPSEIARLVPDGAGGRKACNTTGTATASGYGEHAFNWDVAQRMLPILEEAGVRVVLSRDSDDGVGPCVDQRGTFAAEAGADLLLSIHANGSENTAVHGFFVILADPPPFDGEFAEASRAFGDDIIAALAAAGFPENSAIGPVQRRGDLSGLNHAGVPAVLIELAEMRHPEEAALAESPQGRQRYAEALAAGVIRHLDTMQRNSRTK